MIVLAEPRRAELDSGRLVQPFDLVTFEGPDFWLVYPDYKRTQPKIAAFRDWLLAAMRDAAVREPSQAFVEPNGR